MAFRNDHDAALARADALEHELAETRTRLARAEAALERRDRPAPQPAPTPAVLGTPGTSLSSVVMAVVGAIALVVLVAYTMAAIRSQTRETEERMAEGARRADQAVERQIVYDLAPQNCTIKGFVDERLVVTEAGTDHVVGTFTPIDTTVPWTGHRDITMKIVAADGLPIGLVPDHYDHCTELTLVQQ